MHPDQLLSQIKDLLAQYLQLGPNTPVAAQAQQLSDAIDGEMGGAGPGDQAGSGSPLDALMSDNGPGMPPPDAGGGPPPDMGGGPPPMDLGGLGKQDGTLPPGPDEPPPGNSKSFKGANEGALARLKKRNGK